MKWLKYIGIGLVGAAGVAVGNHFYRQYKLLQQSDFKFTGWRLVDLNIDKTIIELKLVVINMTDIEFDVLRQEYNIYMNDKFVASFKSNKKWRILANDNTEILVVAEFSPKKVLGHSLEALKGVFTDWKNIVFKTVGKIKVGTGFVSATIDVEDKVKATDYI